MSRAHQAVSLLCRATFLVAGGLPSVGLGQTCTDFSPPDTSAPWACCGVGFNYDGIQFETRAFRDATGVLNFGGTADIAVDCCSAAGGPSLGLNNIMVAPHLPDFFGSTGVCELSFCYRTCGGNLNLRVNQQWEYAYSLFEAMPANLFHPVGVHLIAPPATYDGSCWTGTVTLRALPDACIDLVAIGGQEFCIDNLCASDPCECPDVNGDGVVDVLDMVAVIGCWGAPYTPCPPFLPCDVNYDCVVDVSDLNLIILNWGPCDDCL